MKVSRAGLSVVLALTSATTSYPQASIHLVPLAELDVALAVKSAEREADVAEIRNLLRRQAVRENLGGLVDLAKVETVVAALDDATVRDLGSQSRRINEEIAASGATKWLLIGAAVVVAAILTLAIVISDK